MFNHEPDDYLCPFCRLVAGGEDERRTQRDVVRREELATGHAVHDLVHEVAPRRTKART